MVLADIVLLHVPIFLMFPSYTSAVYTSLALYYCKHCKAPPRPGLGQAAFALAL